MTKSEFVKRVTLSLLLTAIAIAIIISFCVAMFDKYSEPSEENTSIASGTASDVYYSSGQKVVIIEMVTGERLQLACPWSAKALYASIGYDIDRLAELLEGQSVEYRKMNKLPWIVEVYIGDIVIDNSKMTSEEITATHNGIIILGLIMLALPICGKAVYVKSKYKLYKKLDKKSKL